MGIEIEKMRRMGENCCGLRGGVRATNLDIWIFLS